MSEDFMNFFQQQSENRQKAYIKGREFAQNKKPIENLIGKESFIASIVGFFIDGYYAGIDLLTAEMNTKERELFMQEMLGEQSKETLIPQFTKPMQSQRKEDEMERKKKKQKSDTQQEMEL